MKADVDLCGMYYELRNKHEDMHRIASILAVCSTTIHLKYYTLTVQTGVGKFR